MIKNLYWLSWLLFLISVCTIGLGLHLTIKHGVDLRNYSLVGGGFMGLAISGFLMTIAYGVPYN